jgi:hypothetical protein
MLYGRELSVVRNAPGYYGMIWRRLLEVVAFNTLNVFSITRTGGPHLPPVIILAIPS